MLYPPLILLLLLMLSACGGKSQDQNNSQQRDTAQNKQKDKASASKDTSEMTSNDTPNKAESHQLNFSEDLLLDSTKLSQPPKASYRQLTGNGMPFTIKIPENWQIKNKPPAGDGYNFNVGEGKADARVYFEATKAKPNGLKPPECDHQSPFQFRRQKGVKCRKAKALYYYLSQNQQRLVFYVKADSAWRNRHADQLDRIARSLAFDDAQKLSSAQ